MPRVAANDLRAEYDVNNEAKILRIEIVFATLKPAVKSETVECNASVNSSGTHPPPGPTPGH